MLATSVPNILFSTYNYSFRNDLKDNKSEALQHLRLSAPIRCRRTILQPHQTNASARTTANLSRRANKSRVPIVLAFLKALEAQGELKIMERYKEVEDRAYIGRGAQGRVWKMRRVSDDKIVVRKSITLFQNPGASRTATLEIETLRKLRHPNIVEFYDVERKISEINIYMEYCEGGTLDQLIGANWANIKAQSWPDENLVWTIALQLSSALVYCHQGKLPALHGDFYHEPNWKPQLHRDIKPANIFLRRTDSGDLVVKLGDFGLAAVLSDATPGTYVGTTQYLPPEINHDSCEWTEKCDIFSLGCTLYALCFGDPPYRFHLSQPENPQPIPEKFSRDLDAFINGCISHEAAHRPDADKLFAEAKSNADDKVFRLLALDPTHPLSSSVRRISSENSLAFQNSTYPNDAPFSRDNTSAFSMPAVQRPSMNSFQSGEGRLSSPITFSGSGLPASTISDSLQSGPRLKVDDYSIVWVVALPLELAAAIHLLDEEHEEPTDLDNFDDHPIQYTWGRMGKHNIVIAFSAAGKDGIGSAAKTVEHLSLADNIVCFLVGIGSGIPQRDIRLGDVVVGAHDGIIGGLFQYNNEKPISSMASSPLIANALGSFQAQNYFVKEQPAPSDTTEANSARRRNFRQTDFTYPGPDSDFLFDLRYRHERSFGKTCAGCDMGRLLPRQMRSSTDPEIHHGIILSIPELIREGLDREALVEGPGEGYMCLEWEAAGLKTQRPCLVIRGICDYADSHANNMWRGWAAFAAASHGKELLKYIKVRRSYAGPRLAEVAGDLHSY